MILPFTEELVRRGYEAINRDDLDELLRYLSHDFELHTLDSLPDTAVYRGIDEFIGWWHEFGEHFRSLTFEPIEFTQVGDEAVVARVHATARGRASGVHGELTFWTVWRARDGKITYTRHYSDRDDAFRSLGVTAQSQES